MGDGGVACAPSQHVMEKFPASEGYCASSGGGVLASKAFKMRHTENRELLEQNGGPGAEKDRTLDERARKGAAEKGESTLTRRRRGESNKGEWQNADLEKGEFVLDRRRQREIEAGEFIPEGPRRRELEKGDFVPDKWRKGGEFERSDFMSGRSHKVQLEKRELILERQRKDRGDHELSRDDGSRRRDGAQSESDYRKRSSSKWEKGNSCAHERESRKYPRAEEPGQYQCENSNGKSHKKDYYTVKCPKQHSMELDSNGSKYCAEHTDHLELKSQREAEEWKCAAYPERSYQDSTCSITHLESSVPSQGGHYRHGRSPKRPRQRDSRVRSPSYLEHSPQEHSCHYDHHDRTPGQSNRSPHERAQHPENQDCTPSHSDRSPHERVPYQDHRDRTPSHSDRYRDRTLSHSHERVRHRDYRDRTPARLDHSSHEHKRNFNTREPFKKSGVSEKQQTSRYEEMHGRKECVGKDTSKGNSARQSKDWSSSYHHRRADDKSNKKKGQESSTKEPSEPPLPPPPPPPLPSPTLPPPPPLPPQPEANEFLEELPSMEEDMDICDTPPHNTITVDSGKWFYIDNFGIVQGPSRLAGLKGLVEEGFLLSDHLIKHSDTDRWVTVENAASPLVPMDLPSIVSDAVTQMISPPEAPGNLLAVTGDLGQETSIMALWPEFHLEDGSVAPGFLKDLCIDERVETLLNGHSVIDGKELESIGEVLNVTFEHAEWEKWGQSEGFTRFQACSYEPFGHPRDEGPGRTVQDLSLEVTEIRPSAPSKKEHSIHTGGSSDWFAGRWSCKGGDWKRNDEASQDKYYKRKLVLNQGYPLCQMPERRLEDPRWFRRDDLYYPSRIRKIDLPPWAFSSIEDKSDNSNDANKNMLVARTGQIKPPVPRGVKGTMLPVVRINVCVVKDYGSLERHAKVKVNERHMARSSCSYSTVSYRNSFSEEFYHSKKLHERDFQSLHKCRTVLNIPRDHVCTINELSLDLGDWYYLDGAGHEHGPSSYSELQELARKGNIPQHSSVFRKIDNIWLPVTASAISSEAFHTQDTIVPAANSSSLTAAAPPMQLQVVHNDASTASYSFHCMHPQFIGYMRGRLHELVMRSYKNREFAAAVSEVLDPWLSVRQQKKEMDKHFPFNSSITKSSAVLAHNLSGSKCWKSEDSLSGIYEDNSRSVKRARLLVDGNDGESEAEGDLLAWLNNDFSFKDICGKVTFDEDDGTSSQAEAESWGLLSGCILTRIFHFLRTDTRSLVSSATTCKRWNRAVRFYKNLCKHIDLSSTGPNCTDSMFQSVVGGYDKKNVTSIGLAGCSNISACVLEQVLQLFPCLSYIDIRGCSQFKDLECKYQNVKWIKSSCNTKNLEESHSKTRSLKQITDKSYSMSKAVRGLGSYLVDPGETRDFCSHETNLVDRKDSSSHPFWQGFYKRTKLFDARKSSVIPSRDARMRQWMHKKSENGYRKMEEFIALSLQDIMKGNRFDFFTPKVAKIEDRMKSGYYVRYGLGSVKDDISRICWDALKAKNRDNDGDLKQVIMSFIRLAERLKENPKLSRERDEMIKTLKDGSITGFYSSATKYSKKQIKVEKKGMSRTQSTFYANDGTDYGAYAFDREIKRSLCKLKKKYRESESETSEDDLSEDVKGEGESTASDTESDLDLHLGGEKGDIKGHGYFMADDTSESVTDDREWGARMTKASLVPPVTRKYEVIDRYLVIADEEEVRRKMQVALPDDYTEKLLAQKSGMEESDMELPEVKEYKPRKMLGVEVIEQEVYGIDPYTHNLLLDSMPYEPDWPLVEKHKFIEEVLLRVLNKQVRHFTGTGNTPMTYPLRLVVEEIQKNSEEDGDARIVKMCQAIIKAMQTRPDDNYIAYRKGLGVVCNKEEGFGEDDFVVEFLGEVYPAWKWFEKQDGIRSLQKNNQDSAPEFYNIYLERPKGDRDGYDLVIVDAMHKANYASRICHSCRPNCEAKLTAVDGQYQIGVYTVRPIGYCEEITYDYHSLTESKEEHEASVCLCGNHFCRGSYLNLSGDGAFQMVLRDFHGVLDRHKLMLEACESNSVSQEDYIDLARAGVGTCLLAGLPDWLVAYSARLIRFINFERTELPTEILKHNLEEKRKLFSDISLEVEKSEADVQAEGVYNMRLQNMAVTLDKVRYVMRRVFEDPKNAPPPLQKLSPEALVSALWVGEGSLVEELLQSMAPHMDLDLLNNLKSNIHAHAPPRSDDILRELRKSLLWLRDELRNLPCTYNCRHDAAADLIHMYAYTKCFFKVREYKVVKSPPVYITPLDLGPKYADKLGSGFQEYCKMYSENYCLGQLFYWYSLTNADPDLNLAKARKGCLALPDISSFYAKSNKPLREHVYGSRTLRFMLSRMEKQPQRPWPRDRIWLFKSSPRFFGSPMLDTVLNKCPLDKEMVHWLRSRPSVFQGAGDG